ncbi:hypothetical protein UFOVP74_38 [uncultured Caudovirales phage]|uniref:Uncharacterized protein n=1 Tax=uncultured Caudovirales phage TaxID=2100421 RepID=A0A6J5KVP8_9CAUD|nr:hypothetical protein UFOVP74_38 [uncultured Caudovirales phage]
MVLRCYAGPELRPPVKYQRMALHINGNAAMVIPGYDQVGHTKRRLWEHLLLHFRILPRPQLIPLKIWVIKYRWCHILPATVSPLYQLLQLYLPYLAGVPCGNLIHHCRHAHYRPIYPRQYL